MNTTIIMDTREPDLEAHPWKSFLPADVTIERATLETGDFVLKGFEESAVVERKAAFAVTVDIGPGPAAAFVFRRER